MSELDPADLAAWNRANARARSAYRAQPITTKSYSCPRCTGWRHSSRGVCRECQAEIDAGEET